MTRTTTELLQRARSGALPTDDEALALAPFADTAALAVVAAELR